MTERQEKFLKDLNTLETPFAKSVGTPINYDTSLNEGAFVTKKLFILLQNDDELEFTDVQIYNIEYGEENASEVALFAKDYQGDSHTILDVFEDLMDDYDDGIDDMQANFYSYNDALKMIEKEDVSDEDECEYTSSGLMGIPNSIFEESDDEDNEDDE